MRGHRPGERCTPLLDYLPNGAWPFDDTVQTFGIDAEGGPMTVLMLSKTELEYLPQKCRLMPSVGIMSDSLGECVVPRACV